MIKEFRGEYSWLSNFEPLMTPLVCEYNINYPTVEHFYQAMKTTNETDRRIIACHPSKGLKKLTRNIVHGMDKVYWDFIKEDVMFHALIHKYDMKKNPILYARLMLTEGEYIQEGNTWNDTFWGVDLNTGFGQNKLGKMIMLIRDKMILELGDK